jgi:hypothetical protein
VFYSGYIVTGGQDSIINIWSIEPSREEPLYTLLGHSDNVCALHVGGDSTIVSGSWDKYVPNSTPFPHLSQGSLLKLEGLPKYGQGSNWVMTSLDILSRCGPSLRWRGMSILRVRSFGRSPDPTLFDISFPQDLLIRLSNSGDRISASGVITAIRTLCVACLS